MCRGKGEWEKRKVWVMDRGYVGVKKNEPFLRSMARR
jgi:hypothetical protein